MKFTNNKNNYAKINNDTKVQKSKAIKAKEVPIYEPDEHKSCFVGGIPIDLSSAELTKIIESEAPDLQIMNVELVMSKKKKKANKGFGFVTFKTHSQQQKFLEREIVIRGKKLDIRVAKKLKDQRKKEKDFLSKRVFMRGFQDDVTDIMLQQFMIESGWRYRRCYIVRDHNKNKTKGIGIVDFLNDNDAAKFVNIGSFEICGSYVNATHYSLDIKLKRMKDEESELCGANTASQNSFNLPNVKANKELTGLNGKTISNIDERKSSSSSRNLDVKASRQTDLNKIKIEPRLLNFSFNSAKKIGAAKSDEMRWQFLAPSLLKKLNEAPMNYNLVRRAL